MRDSGLHIAAQAPLPARPAGRRLLGARRRWWPTSSPAHRLAQEEIFGPVQALIPFDDEAEALAIANGTRLRAGGGRLDARRQPRAAAGAGGCKCGQVFVNNYGAGGGIELPFGGVKHSGHGREKGFEALYGFSTLKTVAIKHD